MPRKPEYKPLLYTTTIRNPERFKDFMHILKRFNGRILNNKTVELFERELFKVGLYRPMKRPETVQDKWKSTKNGELASKPLTDEETKDVYQQNDPQVNKSIKGHKEAGFPKGWPSRFDTQFKLMKVLGFVYYEWGKPINFSQTGNYLADTVSIEIDSGAISREIVNPQNEQIAFMQAFAKQQRCNPFICELNDNIPLILLLEVIKKLNSDPDYNGSGISYKEIPLVIFWKDNDAESLYQRIKLLRKEHRYNQYAANSMLATRISFMNDIANLCELVGADVNMVRKGIGADSRIGNKFLYSGCGYGGSCFPKDVKALIKTAEKKGYSMRVLQAVEEVNENQKTVLFGKLNNYYNSSLKGKTVALWGLAFKPETDDMREATALVIIDLLLEAGCKVKVFDPVAMDECRRRIGDRVEYATDMYDAVLNADALLLLTEWKQFRLPCWGVLKKSMNHALVIDGRNIYDAQEIKKMGFNYLCIGSLPILSSENVI